MPAVSVVIPAYNHEGFIGECIQSVLDQTFQDFEIIITDDASSDRTVEVIEGFHDPRITLYKHERNQGQSVATNHCIRNSSGTYIAALNSDDAWEPDKLEKQVAFLEENLHVGAVFSHVLLIDENGAPFKDSSHHYYGIFDQPNRDRYEWLRYFFYHGNALCHPSVLIRRACHDECGLYQEAFAQVFDLDMWVRLCLKYDIYVLPERLTRFRIRSNELNTSGDRPETRIRSHFESLKVLDNYREISTPEELAKVFPLAQSYIRPQGFDAGFALGMIALEAKVLKFTELFGLNLLYEALNDSARATKINELYGFGPRDFMSLTAKHDVVSYELPAELQRSQAWKFAVFLQNIRATVLPRNGRPYRALMVWRGEGTIALARRVIGYFAGIARYRKWLAENVPGETELAQQRGAVRQFQYQPLISVIMPVYNADLLWLRPAIESVRSQTYQNWELCIADDASTNADIRPYLESIAAHDARIKVTFRTENGHISRASNSAIELAAGEFICMLDHDDVLYPHALFKMVELLNRRRELDLIYSDSDFIMNNRRRIPVFKPEWSPDLFYSNNYLNHLTMLRKSQVDEVGAFRPGFEGSQDYDLYLRVVAKTDSENIAHIPDVLYGWRSVPGSAASGPDNKDYAVEAGQRALSQSLGGGPLKADIRPGIMKNTFHIRYPIRDNPLVSIIIADRKPDAQLRACLNSLQENAGYSNREVIVVGGPSSDLPRARGVRWLDCENDQTEAHIKNFAVRQAQGQYVLFLDESIKLLTQHGLTYLLEQAQREEVGVIGPKIIFGNERIYSAGIILGRANGLFAHVLRGRLDVDYRYEMNTIRNYLALSDLCLLVAKDKFEDVGGYDDQFSSDLLSQLDFCLKLHEAGHRHLYTPFVRVYNQAPSKESIDGNGAERFRAKWLKYLEYDPYYSPNFSTKRADFTI